MEKIIRHNRTNSAIPVKTKSGLSTVNLVLMIKPSCPMCSTFPDADPPPLGRGSGAACLLTMTRRIISRSTTILFDDFIILLFCMMISFLSTADNNCFDSHLRMNDGRKTTNKTTLISDHCMFAKCTNRNNNSKSLSYVSPRL